MLINREIWQKASLSNNKLRKVAQRLLSHSRAFLDNEEGAFLGLREEVDTSDPIFFFFFTVYRSRRLGQTICYLLEQHTMARSGLMYFVSYLQKRLDTLTIVYALLNRQMRTSNSSSCHQFGREASFFVLLSIRAERFLRAQSHFQQDISRNFGFACIYLSKYSSL